MGKKTITYIKDGEVISTNDWVLDKGYDIADSETADTNCKILSVT